jgi:hypothetical protein
MFLQLWERSVVNRLPRHPGVQKIKVKNKNKSKGCGSSGRPPA